MNEKQFKKKVSSALRQRGFFSFNTHEPYRAGVPDTYACMQGLSIWLELKYHEGDLHLALSHPMTPRQSVFLRDINEAGGLGLVVIGLPDGVYWERVTEAGRKAKFDLENHKSFDDFFNYLEEVCDGYRRASEERYEEAVRRDHGAQAKDQEHFQGEADS